MKNLLIFAASILLFTSCGKDKKEQLPIEKKVEKVNAAITPKGKLTEVTFEEEIHDFGKIKQGDIVEHTFSFTNTGKNDLIITKTNSSCGCTIPEYSKEPIKPGEKGEIKVSFNSANKKDEQTKTIFVYANVINGVKRIKIKASITGETPASISSFK